MGGGVDESLRLDAWAVVTACSTGSPGKDCRCTGGIA